MALHQIALVCFPPPHLTPHPHTDQIERFIYNFNRQMLTVNKVTY